MDVAEHAYRYTKPFPASETYGMVSQIRRSAVSIAANIAEGYGRDSKGSYVAFLHIAQGSIKELETHVLLSVRVGLATEADQTPLLRQCDDLGRMLRSLIRSLERSAD